MAKEKIEVEEVKVEDVNDVMGWDGEKWVKIGSLEDCVDDVPELEEQLGEILEVI